jgi:hypothetical protein
MAFTRNRPTAAELLSTSQGLIRDNFNSSDDSFGVDHYKFSDTTANNGFHNKVTTPLISGSAHPATTTNTIFYAMQDSSNLGNLQYSRGASNAVPSPLTKIHSPTAPISLANNATTNVMDFTGITFAIGTVYAVNTSNSTTNANKIGVFHFLWHLLTTGPTPFFDIQDVGSSTLTGTFTGSILQVKNTSGGSFNNIFWTMELQRIVV